MEQPMFCVGDKVVCVNSKYSDSYRIDRPLVEGKVYTVKEMSRCHCGRVAVGFHQLNPYGAGLCACGAVICTPFWQYDQNRFAPIDAIEVIESQIHQALKGVPC